MKLNILHIWGVATTLLAASCAQEELQKTDTENLSELAISVTDGGYISEDTVSDAPTRITDNDYRTEFTAGDACGLYIVRDGKIIAENIKLTAAGTGSNVTWNTDAGVELFGGLVDEDYYLYYPYQESMDGKISPAATTDAEFFAPLIKDWQPQADQSDYETGYAASDLMTAKGIRKENADGTISISFSMTHQMAMAIVKIPEILYKFTNSLIPDYREILYVEFLGGIEPYSFSDGVYRYISNPQKEETAINGYYKYGNYKGFTIDTQTISAGRYKTFNIGSASLITVNYELTPGDFLCKKSDTNKWYIIPKLSMPNNEDFVGVVFYVGHNTNDDTDYSNTGIGKKQCNGYVMAVKNLKERQWSKTLQNSIITSTDEDKWNGYSNQQMLKNGGLNNYPAAKFCADYSISAPINTSGWFLPSIAQVKYALNNSYNDTKPSVDYFTDYFWGRIFWSSTALNLELAQITMGNANNYVTFSQDKDHNQDIMPILAF